MKSRTPTLLVAFNDAHASCKPNLLLASLQTIYISQQGEERTCARKDRTWLAMATGVYLLVIGSAYRWDMAQHPTDVNIFDPIRFDPIEREGIRRPEDESAREAAAGP
ncbi:MAG TPA: hypothetical protein VNX60_04815 [Candidatus Acidoferrum sp.]|nr:hypothetical protein [Candidatus Acidoferrum sp.]